MSSVVRDPQVLGASGYAVKFAERTLVIPQSPQSGLPAFGKRVMDLSFGLLALLSLAPLFLVVSIAVLIDSGWPIFFCQKRLGRAGKEFTVLKFRSMYRDAEDRLHEVVHNNE